MKRFSIVCGLILAATLAPMNAIAATFSQLVVYGDSLSDLGRAYDLTKTTSDPAPPYGAATGGRFSNGPIWVEYLAASLGLAIDKNTNFAAGGATTGTVNTTTGVTALGGIQNQLAGSSISDADALYIIWGGANDYLGAGITDPTVPVGNLAGEISALIGRGAKNILVSNLPDLGAIPLVNKIPANATALNTLTQFHNAGLAAGINNLRQVNPSVNLNLLDVNSLFKQVTTNPSNFGFINVTDSCLSVISICNDPNSYLFWDPFHPTTTGHQLIGNLAFNTVSASVPEPTNILGSLIAGGSIIAFKRKLKSSQLKSKKSVKTT
jgi:thermolabile hemolysin